MSKRSSAEFVSDIAESMGRIRNYICEMEYEDFLKDRKTQDATIRNLEIIGEASKNISSDFQKEHSHVPWKKMAGLRDRLIHRYFGVNLDVVWTIVKEELEEIIPLIEEIK